MRIETVLIVHKSSEILLGMKTSEKFGGGKWNGFGGGVEKNETIEECAIRETIDEGGITPKLINKMGEILFKFETNEQDHYVHFFKAMDYDGKLRESNEMIEYNWFNENKLPDEMWPADKHWFPFFIKNKLFKGDVYFDKDFKNPQINIYEVNNLK